MSNFKINSLYPQYQSNSDPRKEKNKKSIKPRKLVGDFLPIVTTGTLAFSPFLPKFVSNILAKASPGLNLVSLVVILTDLPKLLKSISQSLKNIKYAFGHPSVKNFFFILSKLVPLYFIAEVLASFSKKRSFSLGDLAALSEGLKAQLVNLGGTLGVIEPNTALFRSAIWFARSALIKNLIVPFSLQISKNTDNQELGQALKTAWLSVSTILPRDWID